MELGVNEMNSLILGICIAFIGGTGFYCYKNYNKDMEENEKLTFVIILCFLYFWVGVLLTNFVNSVFV